ncbi:hypothetical protein EYF80_036241 [Liparis tanakae]|uniref:Uncharacterized protein n=1 Tax=Liparis tanakae TaxID=230148 RepID=A0A4Z2GK09_9TELE|nr:hypothetical protein EYF80_036241 [Liparis tanakae]
MWGTEQWTVMRENEGGGGGGGGRGGRVMRGGRWCQSGGRKSEGKLFRRHCCTETERETGNGTAVEVTTKSIKILFYLSDKQMKHVRETMQRSERVTEWTISTKTSNGYGLENVFSQDAQKPKTCSDSKATSESTPSSASILADMRREKGNEVRPLETR